MRRLSHIVRLGVKELISLFRDPVLILLIVYCFHVLGVRAGEERRYGSQECVGRGRRRR